MKIVSILLFALSFSVNAANLTFDFGVQSSGTSLYACNAGIKHNDPAGRICYDRSTTNRCNPTACVNSQQNCNCVCTGGFSNDDGEFRLDYFRAEASNWADNGQSPTGRETVRVAAGKTSYAQYIENKQRFKKQIHSLDFFLGSERYGTEYFVDVCFRAPQVSQGGNLSNDTLNWSISRSATITDISSTNFNDDNFNLGNGSVFYSNIPYHVDANLKVRSTLVCKDKSGNTVIKKTSNWASFAAGQVVNYAREMTQSDLRGCFVRYWFKESNKKVRTWRLQQSKVSTKSSFNESVL